MPGSKASDDRPLLVAPDKFKGTLSAAEVTEAIALGLDQSGVAADLCPIADGGEGTLEALMQQPESELREDQVTGPLGRPLTVRWGLVAGSIAVIEVAEAIGLSLVGATPDPVTAGSAGVGELIAAAIEAGASEILVGVGGTASTDGGAGALAALRDAGIERRPRGVKITALCDVRTPWELCAAAFGPQKGADADAVETLECRLEDLAVRLPKDPRGLPMTGAGGGLAGGLWAGFGAELKSGAAHVLDRLGFSARMLASRAVITGEGRLDHQTLHGKAVGEVATRCRQAGVPCHAVVGQNALPAFEQRLLDIESVHEAVDPKAIAHTVATILEQVAPA